MTQRRSAISWAGLALGVLALAVSTQAGYSLAYRSCGTSPSLLLAIAVGSLGLALAGAFLSGRAWRIHGRPPLNEAAGAANPSGMIAAIGALAALLFSLVIVLQGAASLVVSGCLR